MPSIVDLDRYPIESRGTDEYRTLLDQTRSALAARGAAAFPEFVRANAVQQCIEQLEPLVPHAFFSSKRHNVYLADDDPSLPEQHPRNAKQITTSATLGYDHVGTVTALDDLYHSPSFQQFLADALGYERLYPYVDPVTPISLLVYRPGTQLGWHFDNSIFTVTIMLRPAAAGGEFHYAPFLRSDTDAGHAAVEEVVSGRHHGVLDLPQTPGTLVLFAGHRTLHRVTTVEGDETRLLLTMSFSAEPGAELSALNQKMFYGRTADGIVA